MLAGYYIQKPSAEKEAVERWENEGGRLSQNHYHLLDFTGEDYRRHKDQVVENRGFKARMRPVWMRFEL